MAGNKEDGTNPEGHIWRIAPSRRDFVGFLGWGAVLTSIGIGTLAWVRLMYPRVLFEPPSHGSGFRGFSSGWKVIATNFEGPAPRPLERFKLSIADDGQIQVDKGVVYRLDKDESEKPGAFLPYA